MSEFKPKGFTIIELLIIVAVIATIAAIVVLVLNPVEYIKRGRDAQRLRDYTLINNSVNFYSYGASLFQQDPDFDGPNYINSCKGESDQKLFVSVPSDNGESDPTPPSDWTYNRVSSTPLRTISGNGWLPVDFQSITESIRPLNILPVDPINTFADGFYYTYTCGSYELNLRFETSKYNELAASDGGNDPNVYETGSVLTAAPEQNVYTVGGTKNISSNTSGTLVLYPNGTGFYNSWNTTASSGWQAVDEPKGSPNDNDYVYINLDSMSMTFALTDPSQSGTINKVRLTLRAHQIGGSELLAPRIRISSSTYESSGVLVDPLSPTTYSNIAEWSNNPGTGQAWTWSEVTGLEAGFRSVKQGGWTGQMNVYQLYVEVDYTNP